MAHPSTKPPPNSIPPSTTFDNISSWLVVQRHLITGPPAQAIVEYAANNAVDYIVMPTHGRTGFSRLLMGSVAEDVVWKAPCPVITVSPKAAKSAVASREYAPIHE